MDGLSVFLTEAIARRVSGKYEAEELDSLDSKATYRYFVSKCEARAVYYGSIDDLHSTKMYSEICSLAKKKCRPVYSVSKLGNANSYIVVGNMYGQCIVLIFAGTGRDPRLGVINTFEEWGDQGFAVKDMYGSGANEIEDGIEDFKKILIGKKL